MMVIVEGAYSHDDLAVYRRGKDGVGGFSVAEILVDVPNLLLSLSVLSLSFRQPPHFE